MVHYKDQSSPRRLYLLLQHFPIQPKREGWLRLPSMAVTVITITRTPTVTRLGPTVTTIQTVTGIPPVVTTIHALIVGNTIDPFIAGIGSTISARFLVVAIIIANATIGRYETRAAGATLQIGAPLRCCTRDLFSRVRRLSLLGRKYSG